MSISAFSPAVKLAAQERSFGACNACFLHRVTEHHHRDPRGMGGSSRRELALASNCLALCTRCHIWAEHHRALARDFGLLIVSTFTPASEVPVLLRLPYGVGWYLLSDDGDVSFADLPVAVDLPWPLAG